MTSFRGYEGVEGSSFTDSTLCTKGKFVTVLGSFVGTMAKAATEVGDGPVLNGVSVLIEENALAGGEGMVFGLD